MTMIPGNEADARLDQDEQYVLYTTATLPVEPARRAIVEEGAAPLMAHLEELRSRLIKVIIALALATAFSAFFAWDIIGLLKTRADGVPLIRTQVTEMVTLYMKVSIYSGLVLSFPVILYQIVAFVMPGLTKHERRWVLIMIPGGLGAFLIGASFAFFVLLPPALNFLLHFGEEVAASMIRVQDFISVVLSMVFWVGVTFETPLIIFLLARIGIVTPQKLAAWRRWAIVGAFVLGAIITPTFDPFNQTLVALPLMVLYELGIVLARVATKMRANAQA
ncbi:MAG: twin-arginine translocase subunit TatC [Chloroflexi bacterium]|nr:twin-arginine translocase subunit TatC [Chloroflexota bacterium]